MFSSQNNQYIACTGRYNKKQEINASNEAMIKTVSCCIKRVIFFLIFFFPTCFYPSINLSKKKVFVKNILFLLKKNHLRPVVSFDNRPKVLLFMLLRIILLFPCLHLIVIPIIANAENAANIKEKHGCFISCSNRLCLTRASSFTCLFIFTRCTLILRSCRIFLFNKCFNCIIQGPHLGINFFLVASSSLKTSFAFAIAS